MGIEAIPEQLQVTGPTSKQAGDILPMQSSLLWILSDSGRGRDLMFLSTRFRDHESFVEVAESTILSQELAGNRIRVTFVSKKKFREAVPAGVRLILTNNAAEKSREPDVERRSAGGRDGCRE